MLPGALSGRGLDTLPCPCVHAPRTRVLGRACGAPLPYARSFSGTPSALAERPQGRGGGPQSQASSSQSAQPQSWSLGRRLQSRISRKSFLLRPRPAFRSTQAPGCRQSLRHLEAAHRRGPRLACLLSVSAPWRACVRASACGWFCAPTYPRPPAS